MEAREVLEHMRDELRARCPDLVGRALATTAGSDRFMVHLRWGPADEQLGVIYHDVRVRDGRIQHIRDRRRPPRHGLPAG